MSNLEYRRVIGREALEQISYEANAERFVRYGIPPERVDNVLQNPKLCDIVNRAIGLIISDPQLPIRSAVLEIAHRDSSNEEEPLYNPDEQKPLFSVRTIGSFVPFGSRVESSPIRECPFSELPEDYREQVDIFLGIENVKPDPHQNEHEIERHSYR